MTTTTTQDVKSLISLAADPILSAEHGSGICLNRVDLHQQEWPAECLGNKERLETFSLLKGLPGWRDGSGQAASLTFSHSFFKRLSLIFPRNSSLWYSIHDITSGPPSSSAFGTSLAITSVSTKTLLPIRSRATLQVHGRLCFRPRLVHLRSQIIHAGYVNLH